MDWDTTDSQSPVQSEGRTEDNTGSQLPPLLFWRNWKNHIVSITSSTLIEGLKTLFCLSLLHHSDGESEDTTEPQPPAMLWFGYKRHHVSQPASVLRVNDYKELFSAFSKALIEGQNTPLGLSLLHHSEGGMKNTIVSQSNAGFSWRNWGHHYISSSCHFLMDGLKTYLVHSLMMATLETSWCLIILQHSDGKGDAIECQLPAAFSWSIWRHHWSLTPVESDWGYVYAIMSQSPAVLWWRKLGHHCTSVSCL